MAYGFENLEIWQEAQRLCIMIYKLSSTFPKEEIYNLVSQIRRAALSVPTNIAESHGRRHYLDKVNFLYNARGSIEEVRSLLYTSQSLGYMNEEGRKTINDEYETLSKRINAYIKTIKVKKEEA